MIKLILSLFILLGIIGGVYLVQNRVNIFPRADEKAFQEKIIISNLGPTSFAVSYFTKAPTYDFIQYGEDTSVPNVALDSRSKDNLNPQLNTHYFLIKDLKPNTKYYFKINSNNVLLPEGEYLTQQTPSAITGNINSQSFSGTVKKIENGSAPSEAIVFLSSDQGQLLSAPMNEKGEWAINFLGMRKADMSRYLDLSGTDQVKFMAYAGREGFGLFGAYAIKTTDIVITTDEGRIPFYKIDVNQPAIKGQSPKPEDNILWVRVQDFLKGVF